MAHTVSVGEFEGPLGILLELVERDKLSVTAISVTQITSQYLDRIRQLREQTPEQMSEFLQLGARLVYIKSLALLPAASSAEQAEELHKLTVELDEYRRFQTVARQLVRHAATPSWERQVTERLSPADLPLPQLDLRQLSEAFNRAIRQLEPAPDVRVIRRHLSQEKIMAQLRQKLAAGFELQTVLDTCRDRLEIIVTFLALLELIRDGVARVVQADQFAPITVEAHSA